MAAHFRELEHSLKNHLRQSGGLAPQSVAVEIRTDALEAQEKNALKQGIRQVIYAVLEDYAPRAPQTRAIRQQGSTLRRNAEQEMTAGSGGQARANPHLVDRDGLPIEINIVEDAANTNTEASQNRNAPKQKLRANITLQFERQKQEHKSYPVARQTEEHKPAPRVRFSVDLPRPF
jgi:hypothetical protein